MTEPSPAIVARVSTLELFFDLVFVFTVTQLTSVLVGEPNVRGVVQVTLMLGLIFWMYGGYAWLTNAVPMDRLGHRLPLLGGMAGYLVLALTIPDAFGDDAVAFALAYLWIVATHVALYTRTTSEGSLRGILRIAPLNVTSALLVLAGALVGGDAQYALFAGAFLLEWLTPSIVGVGTFEIGAAHFVERHGLVIIIALGESVVAIGIGASHLPVTLELAAVAVMGLALAASLWWTYFGGDDERAEQAMEAATPARRARMALDGFGYWHLLLLLGIIAMAAGLKETVAHPGEELKLAKAVFLSGGVATFLAGDVLFRRTMGIAPLRWRGLGAVLLLATIPIGLVTTAATQLAAAVAVMALAMIAEARALPSDHG